MIEFFNGLEPDAWAGIAGLFGGIGAAVALIFKGLRRDPPEVGAASPEVARIEYVVEELRAVGRRLTKIEASAERIERHAVEIRGDTRVLLDRD
ncbi:hypothetical protein [Salipiger sp.]|uniref:hypothetical protein n=1 Tax=Salipiger sp. TaxID=2078585 RepID=UPI003A97A4FA